jgi:hypothetical protein
MYVASTSLIVNMRAGSISKEIKKTHIDRCQQSLCPFLARIGARQAFNLLGFFSLIVLVCHGLRE